MRKAGNEDDAKMPTVARSLTRALGEEEERVKRRSGKGFFAAKEENMTKDTKMMPKVLTQDILKKNSIKIPSEMEVAPL